MPPSKKILVIDDEPDILRLMIELLEAAGYECFQAIEPVDGLKKALEHRPDLIVLDLMLPKMSGFGFLRLIRINPIIGHIPVLVLSGLYDKDVVNEALDLGAKAYLTKGCEPEELIATIRDYA